MAGLIERLEERGLLQQVSDEGIADVMERERPPIYIGFDPTADSLHVGSLVPIMCLAHAQRAGHTPIVLIGGATGMIGDPSGKSVERNLLTAEKVLSNIEALRPQFERFLSFEGETAATMVNNHDWIGRISHIDWLRDVGKHFTVNYMMAKDSVKSRLEDRDQGISYTEFSYMILQAYDFLHLYEERGCEIQGGGNDQWGNITAGIELLRRVRGKTGYGITFPLLTTAAGTKFGKTEKGNVWLDPKRTSPYQFYQYWVRADDRDVERLLYFFTFLDVDEIRTIVAEHEKSPEKRVAQQRLAEAVTILLHGADALGSCQRVSRALFGEPLDSLAENDFSVLAGEMPTTALPTDRSAAIGTLSDLLAETQVCKSKGQARRDVSGGGIYINNIREDDPMRALTSNDLLFGRYLMLRKGRKSHHLVEFSA